MEQDTTPTRMVFRKWLDGGIIALMPDILETDSCVMSYEHVGQHGAADYAGCMARTFPATPDEYAPLMRELNGRGYLVQVDTDETARVEHYAEPLTFADLKTEFRLTNDGDLYGAVMAWWFAVCDEIHWARTDVTLPDEWHFKPSPLGSSDDGGHEAQACACTPDSDLLRFGHLLARLYDICKRKGLDY